MVFNLRGIYIEISIMLNRQQCSSNPCSTIGVGGNGCMTNLKSIGIGNFKLSPEAADAFIEMTNNMPSNIKNKIEIGGAYRDAKTQCNIFDFNHYEKTKKRRKKGTSGVPVALPGTSNHGWGRAIDLSPKEVQRWVRDNGTQYGWCWGEVKSEPWHFTFCGSGPNRWKGCDSICKVKGDKTPNTQEKPKSQGKVGLTQNFYTGKAKENIDMLISKMKVRGITDPIAQAGILATVGKESGFIPQNEIGYGSTPNSRIRSKFSSTKRLSDSKLDKLKSNDEDFFNYVYGPKGAGPGLGNTQPGDGYKFRGRGFNQITGRANYRKYGFESNPESLNNPDGAAEAMINFLGKEGSSLNNKFDSVDEAMEFFVTRNAGGRKKPSEESKARQVLAKFEVGSSEDLGSDENLASTTDSDTSTKPEGEKKSLSSLLGLGDLDAMISLVRGDKSGFEKATSSLGESHIYEEVDRIKNLIKKVL
jgi:predicted chitinase